METELKLYYRCGVTALLQLAILAALLYYANHTLRRFDAGTGQAGKWRKYLQLFLVDALLACPLIFRLSMLLDRRPQIIISADGIRSRNGKNAVWRDVGYLGNIRIGRTRYGTWLDLSVGTQEMTFPLNHLRCDTDQLETLVRALAAEPQRIRRVQIIQRANSGQPPV